MKLKSPVRHAPLHSDIGHSDFTQTIFRLRKTLIDQVHQMEQELDKKFKEKSEYFATKEDLRSILERVHHFKVEMESFFIRMENRLVHTGEALKEAAQHMQDIKKIQGQKHNRKTELESLFSDLNLFNLRRKYHELSLKVRSEEVDAFGYDPIFDEFLRPLFDFLFFKYWRVSTFGMDKVPDSGSCLFVANHSGTLPYDATMLKSALFYDHPKSRELRFMVEDFLYHFPFLGALMNRFGGVRASQENAEQLLRLQMPVVVFPEGVKGLGKLYKDRYQLARFGRGGFIKLCIRTQTKLIPTAFVGPEEIHPMMAKDTTFAHLAGIPYIPITPTFPWLGPIGLIPLPSKWSIHILDCLDFSQYDPDQEHDRVLVAHLSHQVRDQIQDCLNQQIKNRASVWS